MSTTRPGSSLPPGFRFHPTDEELIRDYLKRKSTSVSYPMSIIAEVDIYKFDPWDLPAKAMFGEKEWYFFSPRDRKYPKGARPNRTAASGYWKATGTDKPILDSKAGDRHIGVKKALVFYVGKPPKGLKTNWIMHEYRLSEGPYSKPKPNDLSMRLDDWVLCRIYKKYHASQTLPNDEQEQENEQEDSLVKAEFPPQLPSLLSHHSNHNTLITSQKSCSFSDLLDAIDNSTLTRFLSENPFEIIGSESNPTLDYEGPNQSNYSNSIHSNNYLMNQKLPHYHHQVGSSAIAMENNNNQLKRQHSSMAVTNIDEAADMFMLHPSKKSMSSSCNGGGGTNKSSDTLNQYQIPNQPLFNQQSYY